MLVLQLSAYVKYSIWQVEAYCIRKTPIHSFSSGERYTFILVMFNIHQHITVQNTSS